MRMIILGAILALAACVDEQPVDGRSVYLENCAACHGVDWTGN